MSTTGSDKNKINFHDYFVGMHSVMLALEPRFMFDAAAAATDADVADQAADAFAEALDDMGDGDDSDTFTDISPISAGDEGAYSFAPTAAPIGNSLHTVEAGDGSDDYTFTVDEDSSLVFTGPNAITIADAENDVLIVTLEVDNGVLTGSRVPGVTYEGLGTGSITLTGSASAITEALEQIRYTGNQYYNSEDPRYGGENLTITVMDFDSSQQSPDRTVVKTYEIYVNPVNNIPEVDQPSDINIEIEQNEIGSIPPITIFDPDYGDEITVTLQTENGVLLFGDGVDYEFIAKDTGNGINYNTYIIRGSVDEVNSILADLGYRGEDNFSGTDQILVSVTDGNSSPVETDPIDVLVTPVNQPPEIIGEPDIPSADEGGSVIFDESYFNIYDPDSTDSQIVIKILDDPNSGDIWFQAIAGDDTSWVRLGVGSTFTLQNVIDGRVRYTHDGSQVRPDIDPNSAVDGFRYSVNDSADGTIDDVTMTIDLNPVNQAPVVSVEEDPDVRTDPNDGLHLVVWEGEEDAVIKFVVTDPDQNAGTPHTVVFTSLPVDGTLYIVNDQGQKVEVTVGMEIPMSWIDEGRLTYNHSGVDGPDVGLGMGETRDDSFSIRVVDDGGGGGAGSVLTWEGSLRIEVWQNNDDPEFAFPPEDLNVDSRNPQVIDDSNLSLTDPDSPAGDLTYTITQLPEHGALYVRMWDDVAGEYIYVEVVAATYNPETGKWEGGTHITQSMIDNAGNPDTHEPVLVYHYEGEGPVDLTDSFNFVVRDGAITSWDNSIPGEDKSHEGGIGEYNEDTGRWELTEQTLNINVSIDPIDPGPGDLNIVQPDVTTVIAGGDHETQVDEGGLVQITSDDLNAYYQVNGSDSDDDPSNIRYRILGLPSHGQLVRLNSDGTYTALTPGSHFYQSDIDNGLIFYRHNGSENFTDGFRFSVSDGSSDSEVETFSINVRPVNDTPTVRPGDPIEVDENNAVDDNSNPDPYGSVDNGVVLGPDDIRLYDVDGTGDRSDLSQYDDPNELTFVVTNLPVNGRLYIYSGSGDKNDIANWNLVQLVDFNDTQTADWSHLAGYIISMQDLIDGNLMYFHDGNENISDGFTIVINDNMGVWENEANGSNSVTGEYQIHIAVTPVNDPPRNVIDETLVVDEGGGGLIGSGLLTFTDPDNTTDQITYTVTSRPENGVLYLYQNGRWVALGVNSTFTQADIDNGYLRYEHDGSEWHSDSFTYSVSDGNAVIHDNVFNIDVNPVNIAPEVDINGGDTRYLDSENDMDLGGWFSISDPDYDGDEKEINDEMQITITATIINDQYYNAPPGFPAGSLFGIIDVGDADVQILYQANGQIILVGTREALQDALDKLTYRAANYGDPDNIIDLNSAVSLTVEINDLNNGGGKNAEHSAAEGLTSSATTTIFVSPVDTPPSFNPDGPVQEIPVTLDVNEDERLDVLYNGNSIKITDIDAFDRNNNSITLSTTHGILWLQEMSGVTIVGNLTGEITITGTLDAINKALETLKYVPDANWNGLDQIIVTYGDNSNTGTGGPLDAEGVIDIHVHAVNDQPELIVDHDVISLNGNDTTSQQSLNVPGSDYSINDMIDLDPDLNNDPDLGDTDKFQLTLTLTYDDLVTYFGDLKVLENGGLIVSYQQGGAVVVMTGTMDEINTALANLSVRFTSTVEENTLFNLRFELDDLRNGGIEGADGIVVKDMLIIANIENDPAEINNADDIELDEDSRYVFGTDGPVITIDDPDALDGSLEIRLTVQHGNLNWSEAYLNSLGLSFDSFTFWEDAYGRHYSLVGSLDVINAALAGLIYSGDANWNGQDAMDIWVNDRGNTVPGKTADEINPDPVEQGGDGLVTTGTVNITINPLNDSPTATEDQVVLPSVDEDIASVDNSGSTVNDLFGGIFSDATDQKYDADGNPTGSVANEFVGIWVVGGVNAGNKGTWQYSTDGVNWVDITEDMYLDKNASIRFQPSADYNVRRGEIPALQVRLVESSEYGSSVENTLVTGERYTSSDLQRDNVPRYSGIVNLNHEVNPVNDAPELTAPQTTEDKPLIVDEDTALYFNGGNTISITDVDADASESPDYEITVTLTVENGLLTLGDSSGLSGYQGPSGSLTLTGTLDDINAALATLSYQANENYYGSDKLTINVIDNGNGSQDQGTGELTDSTIVHIRIDPVNDAPVITTEDSASVLEDGTLHFTGENQIVISDADVNDGDGDHLMTVTLSGVNNGTISIAAAYEGLITAGANGSDTITFTGTLDQINAALASLTYTPTADWNGSETLTVTVNDNGNFGSGGEQVVSTVIAITVVPVNDAPEPTENAVSMDAVDEDTANPSGQTVGDLFGGIFSDNVDQVPGGSNADDFAGIVIVGNNAASDQGVWQYFDGVTNSWITIDSNVSDTNATFLNADTIIRFVPNGDFNGTPGSLVVRLVDNAALDANNPILTALPVNGASGLDVSENGGTTRYSSDTVILNTYINPVNDAPTRNGEEILDTGLTAYYRDDDNYPTWTVEDMLSQKFNDARDDQRDHAADGSSPNDFAGIAVTDIPDTQYGHYQYWDGSSWVTIDETLVNDNTALLLSKDAVLRFVPIADITGAPDLYAAVRLIDSSEQEVITGDTISTSILNELYDQTGRYSDLDNQVILVITAIGQNTAPYVNDLPDDLEVTERGDPIRIAEGSTVGDRELLNIPDIGWEEFSISIRRDGGANPDDVFTYFNGTEFVEISAGDSLYYNNVLVGQVVKNADGEITLTFNTNANQESVSSILGNIGYSIQSHNPPETVTLQYVLNDGNYDDRQGKGGELEGYATQVIRVIPVPEDPIAEDNINYIMLDQDRNGSGDGNILWNAYDPDGTPVHVIDPEDLVGEYGSIVVDSNGNYVYVVNPDHPDVMNLRPGEQLVDVITYRVGDGNDGYPATATLTIIIETTTVRTEPPPDGGDWWEPDNFGTEEFDEHHYQPLWSRDRRDSGADRLHLADMSVDKPVVPAVRFANTVSDWEIQSALDALQQYRYDPRLLENILQNGILEGIPIASISVQMVASDSFLVYKFDPSVLRDQAGDDGAPLTAFMADGSPLPYWIFFDAENGTLTITPPTEVEGEFPVVIVAEGEDGEKAAQAVVLIIAPSPEGKPEAPYSTINSATERDALEMDTMMHDAYWEPGAVREPDDFTLMIGAPSLAGQLALIGSHGLARRAKMIEKAAIMASQDQIKKRKE